ncbi:hypothetical protein AB0M47_02840 [Hamadaea sp. NPDC051192]|uniref:hypothetical protein n=1 Tax=Hamadaea sp. NPDC051192 TaxID=3154940 RepID=UPI003429D1E0
MRTIAEDFELCASLLDLGAASGQPREWLTDEHPGVRGCAALAPALADDRQAHKVLAELCLAPRAFDRALGYGLDTASPALRHFAGPPRWALIEAACARTPNFRDVVVSAWMALPHAFRTAPCPELGPFLRAGFPNGWPAASTVPTSAQLMLANDVAERAELWDAEEDARVRTLSALGLPTERSDWYALANGPRPDFRAADLFVVNGGMAIRRRPTIYRGEGVDRTHPELLRRLLDNLLEAYDHAAADGEVGDYRLTIESDTRVAFAVEGGQLLAETGRGGYPSEFAQLFTGTGHCRTNAKEHLSRLAACCGTVSAQCWYDGQGYAQDFADMAPTGPVQSTGPADGTGYRALLELDSEWLPSGTVLPRGLDSPALTDLRTAA